MTALDDTVLLYEQDGPVVTMTLNRPDRMNALNAALRAALFTGLRRFESDEYAQVAIITGSGRAFCAGGDLKEMSELGIAVPPKDFSPIPGRNVDVSKPLIAAVNGWALAGGFLLAQSCDLCLASDTAKFGITEVKRGRGAPWAVPLTWMIPQRVAMELLLSGRELTAQRAYEVGLVNVVTPPDQLLKQARSLAEEIATNAPLSVRAAKRVLHAAMEMGRSAALDMADAVYESVYESEDAQEGPRAFREKRPPVWKGR